MNSILLTGLLLVNSTVCQVTDRTENHTFTRTYHLDYGFYDDNYRTNNNKLSVNARGEDEKYAACETALTYDPIALYTAEQVIPFCRELVVARSAAMRKFKDEFETCRKIYEDTHRPRP